MHACKKSTLSCNRNGQELPIPLSLCIVLKIRAHKSLTNSQKGRNSNTRRLLPHIAFLMQGSASCKLRHMKFSFTGVQILGHQQKAGGCRGSTTSFSFCYMNPIALQLWVKPSPFVTVSVTARGDIIFAVTGNILQGGFLLGNVPTSHVRSRHDHLKVRRRQLLLPV